MKIKNLSAPTKSRTPLFDGDAQITFRIFTGADSFISVPFVLNKLGLPVVCKNAQQRRVDRRQSCFMSLLWLSTKATNECVMTLLDATGHTPKSKSPFLNYSKTDYLRPKAAWGLNSFSLGGLISKAKKILLSWGMSSEKSRNRTLTHNEKRELTTYQTYKHNNTSTADVKIIILTYFRFVSDRNPLGFLKI